jgi:hypothetical protein
MESTQKTIEQIKSMAAKVELMFLFMPAYAACRRTR